MAVSKPDRRWLAVHLVLLAAAGAVLVWVNRDQWFVGDEWEFLVSRGFSGAAVNLWAPHNEHWSTIPIIVWVALRDTVGLGSYWPYISVLIAAHLALTHVIWRASLRSGGSPLLCTMAALVFSLLGSGSENLLWAFQIGFVGSLAFGWLAMLVGDREGPLGGRDVATVGLLVGALMCSAIGVPMVAAAVVATLVRSRSLRRALVVGGVPAAVFVVWYVVIGSVHTGAPALGSGGLASVLRRLAAGVVTIVHAATGTPRPVAAALAGLVILTLGWTVVRIARTTRGAGDLALATGGAGGLALFLGMVEAARGGLEAPRYTYVAAALALPVLVVGLSAVTSRAWIRVLAAAALGLMFVYNVQLLGANSVKEAAAESITRQKITAAASLAAAHEGPFLGSVVDPRLNPDVTAESLGPLVRSNGLPTGPVTPFGRSTALVMLDVGVSDQPLQPLAGIPVASGQLEVQATEGQPCWQAGDGVGYARVLFHSTAAPFGVEVRGVPGRTFQLRVGADQAEGDVRTVAIPDDGALILTAHLPPGTPLSVGFLPARTRVCAIAP